MRRTFKPLVPLCTSPLEQGMVESELYNLREICASFASPALKYVLIYSFSSKTELAVAGPKTPSGSLCVKPYRYNTFCTLRTSSPCIPSLIGERVGAGVGAGVGIGVGVGLGVGVGFGVGVGVGTGVAVGALMANTGALDVSQDGINRTTSIVITKAAKQRLNMQTSLHLNFAILSSCYGDGFQIKQTAVFIIRHNLGDNVNI